MPRIFFILYFLATLFSMESVNAQLLKRKEALPNEKPPKAILVELFTGYKRVDRIQNKLTVIELLDALKSANQKMILDFEDNFQYCPVYYFYDTNMVDIQNGVIKNHLMDKNLSLVNHPIVSDVDTDFFIVYYGTLVPDETTPFDMHVSAKMLVALNRKGKMLPYPLPRTPGPITHKNLKSKKPNEFYRFKNKNVSVQYKPCALRYSQALESFYGKPLKKQVYK